MLLSKNLKAKGYTIGDLKFALFALHPNNVR